MTPFAWTWRLSRSLASTLHVTAEGSRAQLMPSAGTLCHRAWTQSFALQLSPPRPEPNAFSSRPANDTIAASAENRRSGKELAAKNIQVVESSTFLHVVQSEAGLVAFLCSGHAGVILVLAIFICIAGTPAYSPHDCQQDWCRAPAMSKRQS